MDKLKNNNIEPALIVKLILVLVLLLTFAFVSGVVIGKNGGRNIDRTSSDEEGINEKLSVCIFNSDEIRGKYLKLRDAAREKGLIDENDVVNARVICKSVETSPETSPQEKPKTVEKPEPAEKPEPVETTKPVEKPTEKTIETLPETSPKETPKTVEKQESAEKIEEKPVEKTAAPKPAESKKTDKAKTIDEILGEKNASPKPVDTSPETSSQKCRFAIQIFAAGSKDEALAAGKKFKSIKTRVVGGGDNKEKVWYKLRTGCFDSREAAEAELPKIKKLEKSAYIVSE